jgi:hypothetical protein
MEFFLTTDSLGLWLLLLFCFPVASALSDFWENEWIDNFFRARAYTAPAVLAVALYTAAPGETGGGTEVTGGAYARVDHPPLFSNWEGTGGEVTAVDSAGTGGLTQNNGIITFPVPSASWGLVTDMAILDATSGGNFLVYGTLTASKNINNGDPAPTFQDADLDITLA